MNRYFRLMTLVITIFSAQANIFAMERPGVIGEHIETIKCVHCKSAIDGGWGNSYRCKSCKDYTHRHCLNKSCPGRSTGEPGEVDTDPMPVSRAIYPVAAAASASFLSDPMPLSSATTYPAAPTAPRATYPMDTAGAPAAVATPFDHALISECIRIINQHYNKNVLAEDGITYMAQNMASNDPIDDETLLQTYQLIIKPAIEALCDHHTPSLEYSAAYLAYFITEVRAKVSLNDDDLLLETKKNRLNWMLSLIDETAKEITRQKARAAQTRRDRGAAAEADAIQSRATNSYSYVSSSSDFIRSSYGAPTMTTCPICFENCRSTDPQVFTLECSHKFHAKNSCLLNIVNTAYPAPKCPLCRRPISEADKANVRRLAANHGAARGLAGILG